MVQAVYDTYDIDTVTVPSEDIGLCRFIFIGKYVSSRSFLNVIRRVILNIEKRMRKWEEKFQCILN